MENASLTCRAARKGGGYHLLTVSLEGDAVSGIRAGKPEPFLASDFDERTPSLSPDGRWLAYGSNETGVFEVFVRAFPDNGTKSQVSNGGGTYPRWSRAGHDLIFETPEAQIMVASYSIKNDSFVPERPRLWSPKPLVNSVNIVKNFDLAPDGKRLPNWSLQLKSIDRKHWESRCQNAVGKPGRAS